VKNEGPVQRAFLASTAGPARSNMRTTIFQAALDAGRLAAAAHAYFHAKGRFSFVNA
jgi:hypothetical protein